MDGAVQVGGVVVSAGVLLDLVYLTEKGKLPVEVMARVRQLVGDLDRPFTLAPVTIPIIDRFAQAGYDMLGDPFDRLIVATAVQWRVSLVTRDRRIVDSGLVPTMW
jgi:PIN domain nuclease of toxin-antitoxin system